MNGSKSWNSVFGSYQVTEIRTEINFKKNEILTFEMMKYWLTILRNGLFLVSGHATNVDEINNSY